MQKRFIDEGRLLYSFINEVLVNCPKCKHEAKIIEGSYYCLYCEFKPSRETVMRLTCERCKRHFHFNMKINMKTKFKAMTCSGCGHKNRPENLRINGTILTISEGVDPYFGIDLLLQTSFRDEILWFYNLAHLEYVESYLQVDVRERSKDAGNRSLISRLPVWIKQRKSRDDVLKKILKLKSAPKSPLISNHSYPKASVASISPPCLIISY